MSTLKFGTWENPDGTENFKSRAWVNFNGTGTVAIRASGNVASITDNGVGDYTVNFTNAMPDANYSVTGAGKRDTAATLCIFNLEGATTNTVSSFRCRFGNAGGSFNDVSEGHVAIFR